MTVQTVLDIARQQGISLFLVESKLHYKAPKGVLVGPIKQTLQRHKAALIALLQAERPKLAPAPVASEEGKRLLAPYLHLIEAAHRDRLPAVRITQGGQDYDVADYIRRVAAGIWYGETLASPLLPAWLENLARLQAWWQSSGP